MQGIPGRVLAAARVMAGLKMTDLAVLSGASTRTLVKLEAKGIIEIGEYREAGTHRSDTVSRVLVAIRKAGVEIDEDGLSERGSVRAARQYWSKQCYSITCASGAYL